MNNTRLAASSAANSSAQPAAPSSRQHKARPVSAIPSRFTKSASSEAVPRAPSNQYIGNKAINPALARVHSKDGGSIRHKLPQHIRAGLSSPTDKIQSPASKAVRSLRHNKDTSLPKPQVLGSLFKSMQKNSNSA
ncbi:hypothetical protein H4R22_003895 [Coemansia sp. RSA 1290]|nr:hypothetical protein H4R22_003895 [Coemansia sp. RSA 1290]KAJ2653394.1 hypothetical protein IWW40_000448 [Coemansia sp. RSA 1250]